MAFRNLVLKATPKMASKKKKKPSNVAAKSNSPFKKKGGAKGIKTASYLWAN